jgi:hypothetical protein
LKIEPSTAKASDFIIDVPEEAEYLSFTFILGNA